MPYTAIQFSSDVIITSMNKNRISTCIDKTLSQLYITRKITQTSKTANHEEF